jgi:hypothetical protein
LRLKKECDFITVVLGLTNHLFIHISTGLMFLDGQSANGALHLLADNVAISFGEIESDRDHVRDA